MRTDLQNKADKKGQMQSMEVVNEALSSMSKELLVKANLHDVTSLLEKKVNTEDLIMELNMMKQAL